VLRTARALVPVRATCETEPVPGPVPLLRLAAAAALVWPALAGADTVTLGSDLTAPATIAKAHMTDTAFWPTALASGGAFAAPADGQVLGIRLKGIVPAPTDPNAKPVNEVHFQTLAPQSDGTLKIVLTSGPVNVPIGGDPNQISTFTPENLCIAKGQLVDFNVEGGFDSTFYPRGVPFQVFGAVGGSGTAFYEKVGGTGNGDIVRGSDMQDTELLMQYTIGTGTDASGVCGGTPAPTPTPDPTPGPAKPPAKMNVRYQKIYVSSARVIKPGAFCPTKVTRCKGTATIKVKGKVVASTAFSLRGGHTTHIQMKLSTGAYTALRKATGRKLAAVFAVKSQLGTASHAVQLTQ
jgi:hypothetical protein